MKSEGEARKKLLTIRAHPGSRVARVEKLGEGEYKVHVPAPPEKGEANREVVAALADYFGLPASRIRIVRGERSRIKLVALEPGG
jgi:uncharacterized protein (TIGR00251 family)